MIFQVEEQILLNYHFTIIFHYFHVIYPFPMVNGLILILKATPKVRLKYFMYLQRRFLTTLEFPQIKPCFSY